MSMASSVTAMMRRYGSAVCIRRGEERLYARAFIQPLRRRHRLYINDKYTPAGYFDNAYSLYLGESAHELLAGDIVDDGHGSFSVITGETFSVSDEPLYVWAILSPLYEEENTDE